MSQEESNSFIGNEGEGPDGPQGPVDPPGGPQDPNAKKLRRVLNSRGGYSICRRNNKRLTGCCNGIQWLKATACNNDQISVYVPADSVCTNVAGGIGIEGTVILIAGACYLVDPEVIPDADVPFDATRLTQDQFTCDRGGCEASICQPDDCCYGVFTGTAGTTVVNGVYSGDAAPVNLGSTPYYRTFTSVSVDVAVFREDGVPGREFRLFGNYALEATYRKSDPALGACVSDVITESTSSGQLTFYTEPGGSFTGIEYRVDQDDLDVGRFDSHTFGGGDIPVTLRPAGVTRANIDLGIFWRGTAGGNTLLNYNGNSVFPYSPAGVFPGSIGNAQTRNLTPWLTDPDPGAALSQAQTYRARLGIDYQGPGYPGGYVKTFQPRIARDGDYKPNSQPTARVDYARSALSASMEMLIDSNVRRVWPGNVIEQHVFYLNVRHEAEFIANGSCTPGAARAYQLPPGLDENGQPMKKPGQCYGCGQ